MLLESSARSDPALRVQVARYHDRNDRLIEIPLLIAVLLTGILLVRVELLQGWYLLLVVAGSSAVAINFLCVIPVLRRKHAAAEGNMQRVDSDSRWILRAFQVGAPAAALALLAAAVVRGWV